MTVDLEVDEWADAADSEPLTWQQQVELRLDELGKALHAKQQQAEPRPPKHKTLQEFVTTLLAWYRRDAGGRGMRWCAQWWQHPEAAVRFEALWRAFEAVRDPEPDQGDDTWLSTWIRDHVDRHMPVLLDPQGPFGSCTPTEHRDPLPPLPQDGPPDDWWTTADTGL